MLSKIISHLQSKLSPLSYLEEVNGLAQTITEGSGGSATYYTGIYQDGELETISFDTHTTQVFFLLNGNIARQTEENSLLACSYKVKETYPVKLILYTQNANDEESQQMAWHICKTISGKQSDLIDETNLDFAIINTTGINPDKHSVWKQLFSATDTLQEEDRLIEILISIETEGDEACYVEQPGIDEEE